MAVIKKIAAVLENSVEWSYDYEDSATPFTLLRFRCINNHPTNGSKAIAWDDDHPPGDPQYTPVTSPVVAPGTTWVQDVPPAIAVKYQLSVNSRGRIVGMNFGCQMV